MKMYKENGFLSEAGNKRVEVLLKEFNSILNEQVDVVELRIITAAVVNLISGASFERLLELETNERSKT